MLGISAYYHDAAAALLCDGDLVAATHEERLSRVKFDHRLPVGAIDFCLETAGIAPQDVDYWVFYEKPLLKFERLLFSHLTTFPKSWLVFREAMLAWLKQKLWVKSFLAERFSIPSDRILFVEHHVSHAASAMFCSPFSEAAVLTADGVGEWTTTAIGRATADWGSGATSNSIELTHEIRFPHSLGLLYSAFTAWLGFKVNSGEYKVMGMAPYGEPRYTEKVRRLIHVYDDGSFRLNMKYFSFHESLSHTFSQEFVDLFGPPRLPEAPFTLPGGDREGGQEVGSGEAEANQYYADVAASVQRVLEDVLVQIATRLHETTGSKNLVMAGGVALNCVANGRILRETPFEQMYIQPNAGDAGGALGSALHVWHVVLGHPRRFVMEHCAFGRTFSDLEIQRALEARGIPYRYLPEDRETLVSEVADALAAGRVIALFQGGAEWGPRALGNRSILADPRSPEMAETVNAKIKFRELFRPFAPVVTEEAASTYFDLGEGEGQYPQRFMLLVAPVRQERQAEIPAVCHMGTARLQVATPDGNRVYYEVVKRFGELTGVPVLLNTSFNLRGEPMVWSPGDAIETFFRCDLDMLVIGRFIVSKADASRAGTGSGVRKSVSQDLAAACTRWLCCPYCKGKLDLGVRDGGLVESGREAGAGVGIGCTECGAEFGSRGGIPLLYAPTDSESVDSISGRVRDFYEENPFPGYEDVDSAERLVAKARRGIFAKLVDAQIPKDALVLEVGCGTGQFSNFLGIRGRTVFGSDMCVKSLSMASEFASANRLESVYFIQMNLFRSVFRNGTFDVVICNGVLHHTADPFEGFRSIAELVRPGGYIVIGLYNRWGRLSTDARRVIFRLSGRRLRGLDPYLARADVDEGKKHAWFMDQYRNPHESKHSFGEVLKWFDSTGFDFVSSIPKMSLTGGIAEHEPLFRPSAPGGPVSQVLAEARLAVTRGSEGGFFTVIGQRRE